MGEQTLYEDNIILEDLVLRINQIYLDLKSGVPSIRAMYNLDDVIAELNNLSGNRS